MRTGDLVTSRGKSQPRRGRRRRLALIALLGAIGVGGCAPAGRGRVDGASPSAPGAAIQGGAGEFTLTLPAGWRRIDAAAIDVNAALAAADGDEKLFAVVYAGDAGARAIDDLVDARRRHVASIARPGTFTARERRYFIDPDTFLPASLASYSYVSAKSGQHTCSVVLTVVANGRAYQVVGLGSDNEPTRATLTQVVTTWRLSGAGGGRP